MFKTEILKFFENLSFDETCHKYSTPEIDNLISTSAVVKFFTEPFDSENIAKYYAKKNNMSVSDVLDSWKKTSDDACDLGTNIHKYAENLFNNVAGKPEHPKELGVFNFYNSLPTNIIPVLSEVRMYHKKYNYAGTADLILYDIDKDLYHIVDYKTNKDLFKNYKDKRLLHPFKDMLDCAYNKYRLQLSLYSLLLKQIPNVKIGGLHIIWLNDINPNFTRLNINSLEDELLKELKTNTRLKNAIKRHHTKSTIPVQQGCTI